MNLSVARPIRTLLVDDQQIMLLGLEKLLDGEKSRIKIVGKADNSDDAKRLAREKLPDILLLGLDVVDKVNMSLISSVVKNGYGRIVILAGAQEVGVVDRAVLSGARGVVCKKDPAQTILKAIEKVHAGELWLDRRTTSRIFAELSRIDGKIHLDSDALKITRLTRKERDVVYVFASEMGGKKNKQIATKLCISEHTLRNHLTSIFSKLEISNRFELFVFAKRFHQQPDLIGFSPGSFEDSWPVLK